MAVYKVAFAVNKNIYRLLKQNQSIPTYVKYQLGRAVLSIMLNIAEGSAKLSPGERKNFYTIARGSTFECAAIIKFLASEDEISVKDADRNSELLEEISKMLFAMTKEQTRKIIKKTK